MLSVAGPQWNDLISIVQKDAQRKQCFIDLIANHNDSQCDDFARLLLNDRVASKMFVYAVLETWFSAEGGPVLPRTWESLVKAMHEGCWPGSSHS